MYLANELNIIAGWKPPYEKQSAAPIKKSTALHTSFNATKLKIALFNLLQKRLELVLAR